MARTLRDAVGRASMARFRLAEEMTFVPLSGAPETCRAFFFREVEERVNEFDYKQIVPFVELHWHQPDDANHFVTGTSITKKPVKGDTFAYGTSTFVVQEIILDDGFDGRAVVREVTS